MVKRLLELFSGTHSIGKEAHKKGYEVYSLDKDLGGECPFGSKYKSYKHLQEDILTWNYKQYPKGYFHLITASPVCLWWSPLRNTWIGRKLKGMDRPLTREDIQNDIDKYGKPMVDKVREIIDYFKPKYWWIENPKTGKMKSYITDLDYYDVDYCKYCEWGYQKRTRFWTNIKGFKPKICKKDCENIVTIETQKGAVHKGYKTPIKGKTRTLHKNPIGDSKKACQKIHKTRMGTSKTIIDNGKVIRCNTKALREKYKKFKDITKEIGKSTNRLERYRIPPLLINDFLNNC
jgi:hypothetical protein